MGILGGGSQASQITTYSGLQVQTTSACTPITLAWGLIAFTPNVIWYNDFQQHNAGSKSGGKGGLLSGGQQSYTYTCSIMMALCEGPIAGLGQIWQDSSTTTVSLSSLNLSLINGETPQAVWEYLTANYPAQALGYNGVAYVCGANYNLGSSASVGNNLFEVQANLYRSGCNGVDADPALVIQDFLTNPQYGVGFPAGSINSSALLGGSGTSSYQAYCWAVGIAISPLLDSQESASSILSRWLQITNSTAVWTGGQLKIIPYGDSNVTGNGQTWLANDTPLYALTDEDFVASDGDDPVIITRSDPYSAYNNQSIEIVSRSDLYNTGPVVAFDQSAIDRYGLRIGSTITAHEITTLPIAQTVVQLILQRGLYIRNTYQFKLSWEFGHLDPMDLVSLTDPLLGLVNTNVRITDVEEDDDGLLTFTAEEFPQGVATPVLYATQSRSNNYPNSGITANPVNAPVIIEPPAGLTAGNVQLWIGASGANADPNWGGCTVWVSFDGSSYANIGTIAGAATQGVLTAAVANYTGANPDTVDTLAVSLVESGASLASTTPGNAAGGATVCYAGGEYLSFTTATLTGANQYNLTGLYRGLYGTSPKALATGSQFMLLAGSLIKYTVPVANVGDTLYFKFQSFNIFGAGEQSLANVTAVSYVVTGAALASPLAAPTGLTTVFASGFQQLSWNEVVDPRAAIRYSISKGASAATAQVIGDVAHPPFVLFGAGTYYITAYCKPAIGLTVTSPASAGLTITGNMLVANSLATWDQQAEGWTGTLSNLTIQGLAPAQTLSLATGRMAGTYLIPPSNIINLGYNGILALNVTWNAVGIPVGQNVLGVSDFLGQTDVLGSSYSQFVEAWPEIQIGVAAADVFGESDVFDELDVFTAVTWGSWQRFLPGNYQGQFANLRMQVATTNSQVVATLTGFSIQAAVATRIDHYQALSVPSGGLTITFQPDGASVAGAFNGGPNNAPLPYVNATYNNQAGDTLLITALSLKSATIQILNGGVGVARSGVNVDVQGY